MTKILISFIVFLIIAVIMASLAYFRKKKGFDNLKRNIDIENTKKAATARRRYINKSLKTQVLERDDYTCQICGISKGLLDSFIPGLGDYLLLEIDHVTSVANGGDGQDKSNLQTLCWRCNRKKGKDKTNKEVAAVIDYGINKLDRA